MLQDTIADETLPPLFQSNQDPLALLSSPLSSDGDISDTAYPSPLSSSSISEAPASSPQHQHQQQYINDSLSNTFVDNNDLITLSDNTLESLLQHNTVCDDIKLDLG